MQPMRDSEVVVYGRASAVCCLDVLFGSSWFLGIECDDFAGQKFWVVWAYVLRFAVIVTTSLSVKQGPYSEVIILVVSYKLGFGSDEKEARTLEQCALFYNQNYLLAGIRYG
ncbi:hypothetical protein BD770DRAFT_448152 [Pilaira anomala]|nr:hypothetical protein BD770DRAFT_448152 [Pilaira anomala]